MTSLSTEKPKLSLNDHYISKGLHKLTTQKNDKIKFMLPVKRGTSFSGGGPKAVTVKSRIYKELNSVAGQMAYYELQGPLAQKNNA